MLPNVSWQQYAKGCAIDMSPDGSGRFLHMTGRHREAVIYDQGGLNKRVVDLSQLPGIGGSELWGPRWSNDVQYFVVSGPYPSGLASGRFDPGRIYLGKFNPGLTAVDEWIQVTNKKDAKDICAYAWIERKTGPQAGAKQPKKPAAAPVETGGEWPSDRKDLVFLWETAELQKPRLVPDRKGEAISGYELSQRGMGALFDKHYAMRLAGGSLAVAERADEVEEYLLAAWKKAGSLSLEAVITPAQTRQSGPARIVSIGADKEPENFYLGQEGNMLVLHVNTSASDPQGKTAPLKLCPLLADVFPESSQARLDGLAEADDPTIWLRAGTNGFVLVSQDSDFADMAALYGPPPKVIWLRCGNQPTQEIESLLRKHAETKRLDGPKHRGEKK
jgi:predicted nuclease of predicted toxin-antitoxin system